MKKYVLQEKTRTTLLYKNIKHDRIIIRDIAFVCQRRMLIDFFETTITYF
jgi:hypothetical protein